MQLPLPRSLSKTLLAVALTVPFCALATPVRADGDDPLVSKFTINDEDPESTIPTAAEALKQPLQMGYLLMNLTERAEAATKRGDHLAAGKYWSAIAKAVPERSLGFTRACKSYESAGYPDRALAKCRDALGKEGVTALDNLHYVKLLLAKAGKLSDTDIGDVDAIRGRLERELGDKEGPVVANRMACELAVRISDSKRLRSCVSELRKLAPDDAQTLIFSWSLAMQERDLDGARDALARATKAQLPAAALGKMQRALEDQRDNFGFGVGGIVRDPRFLTVVGVALTLLALALLARRRKRLSQA